MRRTGRAFLGLVTAVVLGAGSAHAQGRPLTGAWNLTIRGSGSIPDDEMSVAEAPAGGSVTCAPECEWRGQLVLREETGGVLTGSLSVTLVEQHGACPCPESVRGTIEGTRTGDAVEGEVETDDSLFDHARFEGQIEEEGSLLRGTWESDAFEFSGDWVARRLATSPVPVMAEGALAGLGTLLVLGGLTRLRRRTRR